jgi:hypothetical protein
MGRERWEELDIDTRKIIKLDLKIIRVGMCGLDSCDSGLGPMTGSCKEDNGPTNFIKIRQFIE